MSFDYFQPPEDESGDYFRQENPDHKIKILLKNLFNQIEIQQKQTLQLLEDLRVNLENKKKEQARLLALHLSLENPS
jgi:hypothetical protein